MKRREFVAGFGAAAAWPSGTRAQQPQRRPIVGLLNGASPSEFGPHLIAFHRGLAERSFSEGRNFDLIHLWADGRQDRLTELAADLVHRNASVIATMGGGAIVTRAAKQVTQTIPIVFVVAGDPVSIGLVASMNKPGGNVTGISLQYSESAGKRLGLLRELLPHAKSISWLVNPNAGLAVAEAREGQAIAASLGFATLLVNAHTPDEVDQAFRAVVEAKSDALIVSPDAFVVSRRDQLAKLAIQYRLPVMYPTRDFPTSGGLISYGTSLLEGYRHSGQYVAQVLNGVKPADLPIAQLNHFDMVINLKAAKAVGLSIPEGFLLRADEVIE